jgi:hypothetical protein
LIQSPKGPIDALIGMDTCVEPQGNISTKGCPVQYKPSFGPGYLVFGNCNIEVLVRIQGTAKTTKVVRTIKASSCSKSIFKPPEFTVGKAMGTELPRKCPACKNCKEWQFQMDSLSFKKTQRMEVY